MARARVSGENVRSEAAIRASSGITLSTVPAWKLPTVSTTGSNTLNFLVTIVCRAVTISQAAGIGSAALCGWEACPPRPCTVTSNVSAAAMIVPGRVLSTPPGSCADATCSPYAATGRPPAASSTPSSIMILAPAWPSSPGWNMKITLPGSSPRRAREQPGRPGQHRGVQVVPAGVHHPVDLRRERQPGPLGHRQRVHIAAQQYRRPRLAAAQHRHNRAQPAAAADFQRQAVQGAQHL